MIKRIISCIVSTVIVLGATIAYDRTACQQVAFTTLIQFLFHCHQWQGR